MKRHWEYLKYVIKHKWYVFFECRKLNVPLWIAVLHDWDKFLFDEWLPYAETFYSKTGEKQYKPISGFKFGWNYHQKRNKHHWQYWILFWDKGEYEPLEMPDLYRREMLADWHGAGLAVTGERNTLNWYKKNRNKMILHPNTRAWIEDRLGYEIEKKRVNIIIK